MKSAALACSMLLLLAGCDAREWRYAGFNIKAAADMPWGSEAALQSLRQARAAGADSVALIPFMWQPEPLSSAVVRGDAVTNPELVAGLQAALQLGLQTMLKPHVWVPGSWPGEVTVAADQADAWLDDYRTLMRDYARIAADHHVDVLILGTELNRLQHYPHWQEVIDDARSLYPGKLSYAAAGPEGAWAFDYWGQLDYIGVNLYPALSDTREERSRQMSAIVEELRGLHEAYARPVLITELGIPSRANALQAPWRSPEEVRGDPDPALQQQILAEWLAVLERPWIAGIMLWVWYTDPAAGGLADTDFTVQNKPAESVLIHR